jgi:hypothetical protein
MGGESLAHRCGVADVRRNRGQNRMGGLTMQAACLKKKAKRRRTGTPRR